MTNESNDNEKREMPEKREAGSPAEVRLGLFSFAHMHAASYVHFLAQMAGVTLAGIYDDDPERGGRFSAKERNPSARSLVVCKRMFRSASSFSPSAMPRSRERWTASLA